MKPRLRLSLGANHKRFIAGERKPRTDKPNALGIA
jgi:hypothetical protein